VDGVAYSFSIYLTDWKEKFPNEKESTIALVGALLNGVYLLMGELAGATSRRVCEVPGSLAASREFFSEFLSEFFSFSLF
jgi:hypothetical protein